MGYTAKRTIRKDFDDLGPDIWVEIKNPATVPSDELNTRREPRTNKKGEVDRDDATELGAEMLAKLITAWNVPDPTDERDDAPSMPIEAWSVRKAPSLISNWVVQQVQELSTPT